MSNNKSNVSIAWTLLYCTYGLIPVVAGLDKYLGYLANWSMYLNNAIPGYIGMGPDMFMKTVGVIEIIAGLLVLLKPRIGGMIVCVWLLAISINLITMSTHVHDGCMMVHYDVAVRDIAMAVGAYVLVLLSRELGK